MGQYNVLFPGQPMDWGASPRYCDQPDRRIPATRAVRREVWPSKMFTIKLELDEFTRARPGVPVYDASQGDGGMSLGGIPPAELAAALRRFLPGDRSTAYGDPIGRRDVRMALHEHYFSLEAATGLTPDNIVLGDGGRDLLQKWYQAIAQDSGGFGDVVLVSAAPWGSYPEGPYVNGLNVMMTPGDPDNAFRITPDGMDESIAAAAAEGRRVIGLILTSPDNPTGNYTPLAELRALVEHAVGRGIGNVFLDLMYQAVTDPEVGRYDVNRLCLDLTPEALRATCIMDGLTKSAGASNVRSANLLAGDPRMVLKIKGIATHTNTPNCLGEAASLDVYGADEPDAHPWIRRVTVPTSQSRKIVRARFSELGYRFICDQGYYAFLNVHPWLGRRIPGGMEVRDAATGLVEDSIRNVETLKSFLTTRCGLAIIHGSVFNQPHFIRFSYANAPEYTAASIDRLAQSLSLLE